MPAAYMRRLSQAAVCRDVLRDIDRPGYPHDRTQAGRCPPARSRPGRPSRTGAFPGFLFLLFKATEVKLSLCPLYAAFGPAGVQLGREQPGVRTMTGEQT